MSCSSVPFVFRGVYLMCLIGWYNRNFSRLQDGLKRGWNTILMVFKYH